MIHPNAEIEELLTSLGHTRFPVIDLSLDRIRDLLARLGNPHLRLPPVVHVAGTNGKGSLLAYLKAILEAAGYKVHRYTSPHLVTFNERIVLAGKEIADDYLIKLLKHVRKTCGDTPVTAFEAITALAYLAYAETTADILLLETGLGGRLDATNVLEAPLLTAITPVSMDHMDYLGDTLPLIAVEKAGILKRNVPCVTGPQAEEALIVIERIAEQLHAPLFRYNKEWSAKREGDTLLYNTKTYPLPALAGAHQIVNAATAIACVQHLQGFTIYDQHIALGLQNVTWPGRLQHLKKGKLAALVPEPSELWLDGGHNAGAGKELAEWISKQQKPVHLICGMLNTKDTKAFLQPMAPLLSSLTAIAIEGENLSQSPTTISGIGATLSIPSLFASHLKNAIEQIVKTEENVIILVCGSLSLAGNTLWQNGTET